MVSRDELARKEEDTTFEPRLLWLAGSKLIATKRRPRLHLPVERER